MVEAGGIIETECLYLRPVFRFFHEPLGWQLLYGVVPIHQSEGVATEASRGVVRYAFEARRFGVVVASTDAADTASIRVIDKLGMKFEKQVTASVLDTIYYTMRRNDFRPGRALYRTHP